MQQGKKEKPKVRFTRNDDGSIGVPRSKDSSLLDAWTPKKHTKVQSTAKKKSITQLDHKKTLDAVRNEVHIYTNKAVTFVKRNKKLSIIITFVIFLVLVFTVFFQNNDNNVTNNDTKKQNESTQIPTNVTPSFPVLTPLGNGADQLGGFAKISPEGAPHVYAFTDVIGATPIRVSQQQLPDNLRTDQATKIKELAEGFNAKESLEIGDNVAYIGTSVNGAQSVVYVKGENLVLIASDNIIPNSEWVTYIGNLRY